MLHRTAAVIGSALLVVLVGCSAAPAAVVLAPVAPVAVVATPAPVPTPDLQTSLAVTHITKAVTALERISGEDATWDWIRVESEWLNTQPNMSAIDPYTVAMARALFHGTFAGEQTVLALDVARIVAAAREVPGVLL